MQQQLLLMEKMPFKFALKGWFTQGMREAYVHTSRPLSTQISYGLNFSGFEVLRFLPQSIVFIETISLIESIANNIINSKSS